MHCREEITKNVTQSFLLAMPPLFFFFFFLTPFLNASFSISVIFEINSWPMQLFLPYTYSNLVQVILIGPMHSWSNLLHNILIQWPGLWNPQWYRIAAPRKIITNRRKKWKKNNKKKRKKTKQKKKNKKKKKMTNLTMKEWCDSIYSKVIQLCRRT